MGCGILHRAYVIRKENNKYLLDVISPYEALYSSVFGVQADTLSYSQDRMCRRMFDELIDRLNYREKLVIDRLYGYRCDRCSISELAKDLEELGSSIGVVIRCQHEDIFNMMHRI